MVSFSVGSIANIPQDAVWVTATGSTELQPLQATEIRQSANTTITMSNADFARLSQGNLAVNVNRIRAANPDYRVIFMEVGWTNAQNLGVTRLITGYYERAIIQYVPPNSTGFIVPFLGPILLAAIAISIIIFTILAVYLIVRTYNLITSAAGSVWNDLGSGGRTAILVVVGVVAVGLAVLALFLLLGGSAKVGRAQLRGRKQSFAYRNAKIN